MQGITEQDVACYPDCAALQRECAEYLGVSEPEVVLTNGLDEGLLATTVACFRLAQTTRSLPEAIVVLPAFEMYAVFIRASGGRVVGIPAKEEFEFPLAELLDALTPNTRLIILNNPNNPTGRSIPREAIREIARRVPPEVSILIDEAYCDFSGDTFLGELECHGNVIVGRTFAKAHGLAGLRAGCLVGQPERLEAIRDD